MENAILWVMYFYIYSVLGWVAETIYCSVGQRSFAERGFLNGPYCPIYGFGAIIILQALYPYTDHPAIIFLLGMVLTSALEYMVSVLMEKLFHMRWWDYSEHRFNLNGRVCLLNSTLFGILCLILTMVIHPFLETVMSKAPFLWIEVAVAIFTVGMAIDLIFSVRATLRLGHHLDRLKEAEEKLRHELEEAKENTEERFRQWLEEQERTKTEIFASMEEGKERIREHLREHEELLGDPREQFNRWRSAKQKHMEETFAALKKTQGRQERRLLRSFPHLESQKGKDLLEHLRENLKKRIK